MTITRRRFLAALATIVAAPRALAALTRPRVNPDRLPVLWADGEHDDAPAINALWRGERVWDAWAAPHGRVLDGRTADAVVRDRRLFVASPLTLPRGRCPLLPAYGIVGCYIRTAASPPLPRYLTAEIPGGSDYHGLSA